MGTIQVSEILVPFTSRTNTIPTVDGSIVLVFDEVLVKEEVL